MAAEVVLVVVVATLAVAAMSAALLVEARAPSPHSTVAAFRQRRLSGARTLPAEVSAHQMPHRDSIMVVLARLPWRRGDSLAQSGGPRAHMSADRLRQLGNQTA